MARRGAWQGPGAVAALGFFLLAGCLGCLAEIGVDAILSTDGLSAQAILQHHGHAGDLLAVAATAAAAATQQHRAAPTLGYVTPWNGAGYEVAKHCRCSLDYVAPVWYQLRSASSVLQLTGGHDVDAGWMAAVRAPCEQGSNHTTLIVPRVIFELQGQEVLEAFRQPEAVTGMLASEAAQRGFDGWVFEGWAYWHALGITQHPQMRQAALGLLHQLAAELAKSGRHLLLAVPPLVPAPGRPPQLTQQDAEELLALADGLSVMTYDYSLPQQPGPNAPLPWWERNADAFAEAADRLSGGPRHKVLLGLNWYGNEYVYKGKQLQKADAVLAGRLLEVLRQQQAKEADAAQANDSSEEQQRQQQCSSDEDGEDGSGSVGSCSATAASSSGGSSSGGLRIQWLDESREHLFRWREPAAGSSSSKKKAKRGLQHLLYFPTPAALAERLAASGRRGMGAAAWELGQGMDAFCGLW